MSCKPYGPHPRDADATVVPRTLICRVTLVVPIGRKSDPNGLFHAVCAPAPTNCAFPAAHPTSGRVVRIEPCRGRRVGSPSRPCLPWPTRSARAVDDVEARVGVADGAHPADGGRPRGVLELLLHLARTKGTEVAAVGERAAVGPLLGKGGKPAATTGPVSGNSARSVGRAHGSRRAGLHFSLIGLGSALSFSISAFISATASASDTPAVDWLVRRLTGLRDPWNLISRCDALIWDMARGKHKRSRAACSRVVAEPGAPQTCRGLVATLATHWRLLIREEARTPDERAVTYWGL